MRGHVYNKGNAVSTLKLTYPSQAPDFSVTMIKLDNSSNNNGQVKEHNHLNVRNNEAGRLKNKIDIQVVKTCFL